jgi:putative flavoprotein involved in K+ transport
MNEHDVIVIGGGQMGLSLGYYLRRAGADFVILDAQVGPGRAWRHGWKSLKLFSPSDYSSLSGWPMPPPKHAGYPERDDVISYLTQYEERYKFPILRPIKVAAVEKAKDCLKIITNADDFKAKAVISATGTWSNPYIPYVLGQETFRGQQVHSANYIQPDDYAGQSVLIIGGGNSGAQIMAEIAPIARALWITTKEPLFLPDDVDGRVLFNRAVARMKAKSANTPIAQPIGGIGDIVMVSFVKAARDRGDLVSMRPFVRMTYNGVIWPDGSQLPVDTVIWCTGFRPALGHLAPLGVLERDCRVQVENQRATKEPRLWLAGYGDWTGAGSATLMGAARTARDLVARLLPTLGSTDGIAV